MKKLLSIILVSVLMLCTMSLVSCDDDGETVINADISEDTSAKQDKPASSKVTEEQFDKAMQLDNMSNVTVHCEEMDGTVLEFSSTYHFDNGKILIEGLNDNESGSEFSNIAYFDLTGSEPYGFYYFDEPSEYMYRGWVRVNSDLFDSALEDATDMFGELKEELSFMKFSNCKYSDEMYSWSYDGETFKFKFDNGVLTFLSFENSEGLETWTFSKHGTTSVSLPAEYKDMSELIVAPSSEWRSYFEFDNVTVSSTQITYANISTSKAVESLKLDGDKRLKTYILYAYDEEQWNATEPETTTYFDGENTYENGTLNNDADTDLASLGMVGLFEQYETSFTETSEGVFEAEQIVVATSDNISLTDIKITVAGGKISSAEYTLTQSSMEINFVSNATVIFTDWGTTTVA